MIEEIPIVMAADAVLIVNKNFKFFMIRQSSIIYLSFKGINLI